MEPASPSLLRTFSRLMADPSVEQVTFVSYRGKPLAVESGDTTSLLYGGAIDIGTTSVVLYAYDLNSGALLHTVSALNGQIVRGADVITRILHTRQNEDGLDELNGHIRTPSTNCWTRQSRKSPVSAGHLYHLVLCGNSTMQHLFLGLDPYGLSQDPFVNITRRPCPLLRRGGRLSICPRAAVVEFLPLLGGFVGADTAAVLLTLPTDRGPCLMVDLGTNGEIAVGSGAGY